MLAELQTIDIKDVTLTQTMILLGVVPMIVVQLFRAVMEYFWPVGPDGIKKPLFMLVGIGTAVLMFYVMAMTDWLVGGIIIGLTATGSYELTKNMGGIVKKKVPNGTAATSLVLLLCFLLLAAGCMWAENPKADLLASQKTFSATVDSLTALQISGKFSPEETGQLTILIHQGQQSLIEWEAAIKAGRDSPDVIELFQAVLTQLIDYNLAKEG
ncbi:MAG TPA: hypothetical protein VMY06_14700 [Sedimentisphaerales bacterium]|nr:hypothetical protein [Sedimentisphaerales bacterium]HUU15609.1 hypothetical protein [Sedimentisphaerales bacterium]